MSQKVPKTTFTNFDFRCSDNSSQESMKQCRNKTAFSLEKLVNPKCEGINRETPNAELDALGGTKNFDKYRSSTTVRR